MGQKTKDGLAESSARLKQGVSWAAFSRTGSTGGKAAFKLIWAVGRINFFVVLRAASYGLEARDHL